MRFVHSISQHPSAFTLIELLIVVAIISVLAAIAVPNFMEAQVRCKVARTQADHRALVAALEAYRVDRNRYPTVPDLYAPIDRRLIGLTTPVAYVSALPVDPFWRGTVSAGGGPTPGFGSEHPAYVYVSGNIYFATQNPAEAGTLARTVWSLAGRGPDGNINGGGYCMAHPIAIRNRANVLYAYDPTNGTLSEGDILTLSPGSMGAAGTDNRND